MDFEEKNVWFRTRQAMELPSGGPWVRIPSGYGYKLYSLDGDEEAPAEEIPEA